MRCARCDGEFDADLVVAVQGQMFCATCKSEHIADLRSGVSTKAVAVIDAPPFSRFVAFLIDRIIMFAGIVALFGATAYINNHTGHHLVLSTDEDVFKVVAAALIGVAIGEALLLATAGRTPGKALLHLRVVSRDGSPLRRSQAWLRTAVVDAFMFALLFASADLPRMPLPRIEAAGVAFLIEFSPAPFAKRRLLHDLIAGTRVVKT